MGFDYNKYASKSKATQAQRDYLAIPGEGVSPSEDLTYEEARVRIMWARAGQNRKGRIKVGDHGP